MVSDEQSTRIAHMADAALLQYAGWNFGDYQGWVETDDTMTERITEEEWDETEKFGPFVHAAVARWLADIEQEVNYDLSRTTTI
jgi:hypothetical protein